MTPQERTSLLENSLRLILYRHFEGRMNVDRVLPGEKSCIVEHGDGTRGVVAVSSIFELEAA